VSRCYVVEMTGESEAVAQRVRELRHKRGWSAQDLANRCAEIGAMDLTADVLANIETGRRHPRTGVRRREVTVEELLSLARALDVLPSDLLEPLRPRPLDFPESVEQLRRAVEAVQHALAASVVTTGTAAATAVVVKY
jgi:transcriptional regulator with XRE-family HTH domain